MSKIKVNYPLKGEQIEMTEAAVVGTDSFDRRPTLYLQVPKETAQEVGLDEDIVAEVTGSVESVGKDYDTHYEIRLRLNSVEFNTENAFEKLAREDEK